MNWRKLVPSPQVPQLISPPMNKISSPRSLAILAVSSLLFSACEQEEPQIIPVAKTDEKAGNAIETAAPEKASKLFSRPPYLQLGTPESMFIVWRTSEKIDAVVKFGTDPSYLGLCT